MNRLLSFAFVIAAVTLMKPDDSAACGFQEDVVPFIHVTGPDMSTDLTLDGAVGIIDAQYEIDELAIAYRHLVGLGFDDAERASVIAMRTRTHAYQGEDDFAAPWIAARRRVVRDGPDHIASGYTTDEYAYVQNCSADAFARAATTLDERIAATATQAPEVLRFVEAQDQVFHSCARSASTEPLEPPADATRREKDDRTYQRAARALYLGDNARALAGFEAIAADPRSEWRQLARYLVARVHQRRAYEEGRKEPELREAMAVLDGILADPAMHAFHASARDYRGLVGARLDPAARVRELSIAIAAGHHGAALGNMLTDLERLETEGSFTSVPSADRFGVFVTTIRHPGPASAARAAALERSTGSPAFLVAALLAAPTLAALPRADADRLLARAAALSPSHPAYVTVFAHRARLLFGREGVDRRAMYRAIVSARDALGDRRGLSAPHTLTLLAFAYATTLDEAIAMSGATGYDVDASGRSDFDFHAEGKHLFDRLPLSEWARVARGSSLPEVARDELATVGYARAVVTENRNVERALAPIMAARFPDAADAIRAVSNATNDTDRRYARIWLLLHASAMRFELEERTSLRDIGFDSGARYFCSAAPDFGRDGMLEDARRFGSSASASRAAIARLPPAGVVLARAAIAAVTSRPNDPRNAELLGRAVRASRWACPGPGTRAASRDAFRLLHARYPASPEARDVRYFYGDP